MEDSDIHQKLYDATICGDDIQVREFDQPQHSKQ